MSIYRGLKSWFIHEFQYILAGMRRLTTNADFDHRLLIFDDIFPHMLSAFRIAEFNTYLDEFYGSIVYSTASAFYFIDERRPIEEVIQEYNFYFPENQCKVRKYTHSQDFRGGLAYTIFIDNAFNFIRIAELYQSKFAFTLYPGGGFQLGDRNSDEKLLRVFSSPSFCKVIVTQQVTYDYLVDKKLCSPDQIEFIYGGVLPSQLLIKKEIKKKRFPKDKNTFDICFVANKYTQQGIDKGYDLFIEVAKALASTYSDMEFHVVGSFDSNDIDVSIIQDRIHFYGTQFTDFFPSFYSKMDIVLSPNRPFILAPGGFDGFPTGACIEAGLSGVAVFCSDPLQQNIKFQDGKNIIIIQTDINQIFDQVEYFYNRLNELYKLSCFGQKEFRKIFDLTAQMQPRIDLLNELLEGV